MFFTESEPCRMCTETSAGATRSTLLLPGRGSDYIWSINTHWLWEALCLSLFLLSSLPLSVFSSLCLASARLLRYDIWSQSVKQSVFDAIFSYIIPGFASIMLLPSLYPSDYSFISSVNCWNVSPSVTVRWSYSFIKMFVSFTPRWMKGVNCSALSVRFPPRSPLCSVIHPDLWGIYWHLSQTCVTKRLAIRPCLQMGLPYGLYPSLQ